MNIGNRLVQAGAMPIVLVALTFVLGAASNSSATSNRAGVIVLHGNGQKLERCVDFTETQITGIDLLTRAGLDLNVDPSNPVGIGVCRLDREGCTYPAQPCFCQCTGSTCAYWSYWHLTGGVWKYSSAGASNSLLHNGDVDGWVWGPGSASSAPPSSATFDQVCALAAATSTFTATNPPPTNTLSPASTATRTTATSPQSTNTPVQPSRTLTISARKSASLPTPQTGLPSPIKRESLALPTSIKISTPTLEVALNLATAALSTSAPESKPTSNDDEQADASDSNASAAGAAKPLVGLALTVGGLCGAVFLGFGIALVAIKRLT